MEVAFVHRADRKFKRAFNHRLLSSTFILALSCCFTASQFANLNKFWENFLQNILIQPIKLFDLIDQYGLIKSWTNSYKQKLSLYTC